MTSSEIKIILPGIDSKHHDPPNIPYSITSQHSLPYSHQRTKWTLTKSHVQKHIPTHPKHFEKTPMINTASPNKNRKPVFFTEIGAQGRESTIQKSKQFISIVKSHRKDFLRLRMITQPAEAIQGKPKAKELYSYLQRDFIHEKKGQMSKSIIQRFKRQSPERLLTRIEEKGRRFLLERMQKDFENYKQIDNFKNESIKTLIEEEVQRKKAEFRDDYGKRYSSPYFSFLTLSNQEQSNIILRKELKTLHP